MILAFMILFAEFCIATEKVNYENYSVIRTTPQTMEAVKKLREFGNERPYLEFWIPPSKPNAVADILTPPKYKNDLLSFLNIQGYKYEIFIPNIQELIDKESYGMKYGSEFGWNSYHTLNEIESWLGSLADKYSQVNLIHMGNTYEGRNLTGAHISFSDKNRENAIFIESNIHAREWISSAVSTYILNEILTSTDPDIRKMAESYDWYILPVANSDGFDYTHKVNRLWRKTKKPYGICAGADPNRNWDNHWSEYGASTDPCSEAYAGPNSFSETCTESLSQYLKSIGKKLVAYISFHSYSQLLMVPYGYSPLPLDNYNLTYSIGLKAAESLARRYGTEFEVGNIYNTVYPASGGSVDWVKATFKTPLVYVYELRDTGRYGFILPPDQILPSGEETLDSIVRILKEYENSK